MTRQRALRALVIALTAAGLFTSVAACKKSEEKAPVEATKPATEAPPAAAAPTPEAPAQPAPTPEQKPQT